MLLAIDIGNSNIVFGLFKGKRLLKRISIPTSAAGANRFFIHKIKRAFYKYGIETIAVCSVVPRVELILAGILRNLFGIRPLVIGRDIRVPIKNLYRNPKQVGQDRLVNAYAGYIYYKAPLVIVDFGTAVTFDVVSKGGEYLGGIIAPGVQLSLNALADETALLPRIKLRKIASVLGRTTEDSIASGAIYGFASMCDGLISRLRDGVGLRFYVIATGGDARLISRYSRSIKKVDEELTLKGINLTFRSSNRPQKD